MSDIDEQHDTHEQSEEPHAKVHVSQWSPWIWVVPALAIFFAGYLVVRYGFFGGGDITVRFAEARGLDRYSPVRFRGAKVGTVQKITIDKDLRQVVVNISMDASMNHALRKGTRFWIVEPGLESGGLGGILSGTYIGIAPGNGAETSDFIGQEYAPILAPPEAGKTVVLEAKGAGSVGVGTPIEYHGIRVGRILGSEYDEGRGVTIVHAFIVQRFANNVRQATRFWRGGGLNISLGGGGVSMAGGGLGSLISSPISFVTPEVMAGAPVSQGTHFDLYESQNAAIASAGGPAVPYVTYFPGPIKGLTPGTPVTMKGLPVGSVSEVRLRYVPETASLESPVTFQIDPRKLEMDVNQFTTPEQLRAEMNDAMAKLVNKGMRATLSTSLVLPGAGAVALDFVAPRGSARLGLEHDPPIVPAAGAGSGLEGALAAVNDVAARIRNLPIEEIAGNLRSASSRINSIVQDPAISQSVQRLNASLADVEKAAAITRENVGPIAHSLRNAAASAESAAKTANENVAPIVSSLRNAATSAEATAARAQQLIGSSQRQGYDLGKLIKELTDAAEAIRALATYLNENPDSLLKGRGK